MIVLYYTFVRRFPGDEPELTRWIVQNRVNPWEPFGSQTGNGARTLAGRNEHLAALDRVRASKAAQEEERHLVARVAKAQRATERLRNAVRRGDVKALAALFDQGADATAVGPLLPLAVEHARSAVVAWLQERDIQ